MSMISFTSVSISFYFFNDMRNEILVRNAVIVFPMNFNKLFFDTTSYFFDGKECFFKSFLDKRTFSYISISSKINRNKYIIFVFNATFSIPSISAK